MRILNYMNSSSTNGISLDSIRRMDKIVGSDNKSLLYTTVDAVYRHNTHTLSFVDRYKNMKKILKYDVKAMDAQIEEYKKTMESICTEIDDLLNINDSMYTDFIQNMQSFISTCRHKIEDLRFEFDKMMKSISRCTTFYASNSNEMLLSTLTLIFESVVSYSDILVKISTKQSNPNKKGSLSNNDISKIINNTPQTTYNSINSNREVLKCIDNTVNNNILAGLDAASSRKNTSYMSNSSVPTVRKQTVNRKRPDIDSKYKKKDIEGLDISSSNLSIRERQTVNKSRLVIIK